MNIIFLYESSLEACFLLRAVITCICSHKLFKLEVISENKSRVPDTSYANNDYTYVAKVYEDYTEQTEQTENTKAQKDKKLVIQKNR